MTLRALAMRSDPCESWMMTSSPQTSSGIALVTGGAQRIGAAIALHLARSGYRVVIHAHRHIDDARQLVASIKAEGGEADCLAANLMDETARANIIAQAASIYGPLSLLVNNASVFLSDRFDDEDEAVWNANFEINLKAPLALARSFARQAPRLANSSIVNLVDHRVMKLTPQHFSYTLSKAALYTATLTMAQALAPDIRVNAIGPGPTFANSKDGAHGLSHEISGVPLQRGVAVEDIADAVLFLARASSVTGQMIAVDSGQHIGWKTPDILI